MLTALDVEFTAVRTHLRDERIRTHPEGTDFYVGTLPDGRGKIALVQVGQGNTGAAVLTERAISFLRPKLVMFVGIAGRLMDDLGLGDVVVPPRIYLLLRGYADDEGFHCRPEVWHISHALEQLAQRVHREGKWQAGITGPPARRPGVFFRPVVAGDVVLNGSDDLVHGYIRQHYNDAAAIEMESAGMAHAAALNQSLPAMAVRSISDTASGDKDATDREGWQARAAQSAAAFAVAFLAEFFRPPPVSLDELAAVEDDVQERRELARAKISDPALPDWVAKAPELRDRKPVLDSEIDALQREIAAARTTAARQRTVVQDLLDRRTEMRGRLAITRATVNRLGLAECEHGEVLYQRAHDLLWSATLRPAHRVRGGHRLPGLDAGQAERTGAMTRCVRCPGSYESDGYCGECGHPAPEPASVSSESVAGPTDPPLSTAAHLAQDSQRGSGLTEVPPIKPRDPSGAVLGHPQVPPRRRRCRVCDEPVGQATADRPGRDQGFCPKDGTPF